MAAAEVQAPQSQENGFEAPEKKSFSNRLYELPVVVAAIEQLGQLYGTVKEKNSVTKMACNAGESTLSVAAAASKPLIETATNTALSLAKPVVGKIDDPGKLIPKLDCFKMIVFVLIVLIRIVFDLVSVFGVDFLLQTHRKLSSKI